MSKNLKNLKEKITYQENLLPIYRSFSFLSVLFNLFLFIVSLIKNSKKKTRLKKSLTTEKEGGYRQMIFIYVNAYRVQHATDPKVLIELLNELSALLEAFYYEPITDPGVSPKRCHDIRDCLKQVPKSLLKIKSEIDGTSFATPFNYAQILRNTYYLQCLIREL